MGILLLERAYAKINLSLDVLAKRADGYHEVDMVMQTIDLSDSIWLEKTETPGIHIESNVSFIPLDSRNLAYAAAEVFLNRMGISPQLSIRIDKSVPVAAGLAGGSADAAAVLRGLNRLYDTGLSLDELAFMGEEIGSDVPFCVYGGCARATGRGEQIERIYHDFRTYVVLVKPPVFVSTTDVYRDLTASDIPGRRVSSAIIKCLLTQDFHGVQELIENDLMPVTLRTYPEVEKLYARMQHVVSSPVHMSGSGPTLYCLAQSQGAAQRLYNALRGFTRDVYLCRTVM